MNNLQRQQTICPTIKNSQAGGERDPYRQYVGQEGHIIKNCATFDERNTPQTLCKMTVTMVQKEPKTVYENYLTLNDPVSERIISCQNIAPSYYPNMTQEMIGKRPVYSTRNCEYNIPEIILKNRDQLVNHDFKCYQPNWCWECM